jgi:hypothetical protein
MINSQECIQKIVEFQKVKSEELNRPVTYSEALALWFNQVTDFRKKKKRVGKVPDERMIY